MLQPIKSKLATPGKRFEGQFIDSLISYALGFTGFYLLKLFVSYESAFYFGLSLGLTYLLLSDSLPNGQSLGKRFLNIRVVDKKTMRPCSALQSFLRNVTFPLGIFDWGFIFFGSRRRLGDFIASTIVVKNV